MRAIVFGIPGVGKTSVVSEVIKSFPIEKIHFGQYALELAVKKGIVGNIDEIRKTNIVIQKQLQSEAAKIIAVKMDAEPNKNYLIETHAIIKTPQGFLPGLNQKIIEMFKPDLIIVINTKADTILVHRQKDAAIRQREDDKTLDEIRFDLNLTEAYAATYAVIAGAMLMSVENKEGDTGYAAKTIVDVLNKFIETLTI